MKPTNKAARVQMNKAHERAKHEKARTTKSKTLNRRYEVYDDSGLSIGFLFVHGKVKG